MIARRLKLESAADAAMASVVARKFAQEAGFSAPSGAAFATAVSELVTNVIRYAGSGWATLRVVDGARPGVEAIVQDRGPGIPDLEQAMRDHVSTGGSLGLGLPGTKRLVDEFEIRSEKELGTWVRIVKHLVNAELDAAVHVRPYPGAPRGGDLGVIRVLDDGALIALVDATGHGLTAYAAAQTAHRTLLSTPHESPDDVLADLHEALKGSVGAAAAVARLRPGGFTFAGIGGVAGWCAQHSLLTRDGVLGQRYRSPRVSEHQLASGQWLILNTDGVSYAGGPLPAGEATTVARGLVERSGKEHDDAAVLAARWIEVSR